MRHEFFTNGIHYTLHGDYYLPDILAPEDEHRPIGRWGWLHLEYMRSEQPEAYLEITKAGKLYPYLAELNEQADKRYRCIVAQMIEQAYEAQNQQMTVEEVRQQLVFAQNTAEEIIKNEMVLKNH